VSAPPCRLQVADGIATLTLDRPENRNALSAEMVDCLDARLAEALDDDGVRVVVLTGTGNTFCAGADLKSVRPGVASIDDATEPPFVRVLRSILDSDKPVVCRVNGHVAAGGNGLVAACDFAIAPESARFAFTEVRIGVAPAIIAVVCLPRLRLADAQELFLTGERVSAARAAQVGLITRAVPDGDLDHAVDELLDKLLLASAPALAAAKELLQRVPAMGRDEAFAWTAKRSAELFATPEAAEGMRAFAERRRPAWAVQRRPEVTP
jgi:methylglutaconyl-CoA hydratase